MSKKSKKKNKFLDGSNSKIDSIESSKDSINSSKNNFLGARLKAFITDIFLINMPILYFTTYVILGGKESFQNNQIAILCCGLIYAFILVLFFYFSGQTPGFRYAEIMLVRDSKDTKDLQNLDSKNSKNSQNLDSIASPHNAHDKAARIQTKRNLDSKDSKTSQNLNSKDSKKTPKLWQCVVYVFTWLVEITFFLWIFAFLRKDKKTLHEILSHTKIIYKQNKQKIDSKIT